MTPTFDRTERFAHDYRRLSEDQRAAFTRAVAKFVTGLRSGDMPPGLRVRGIQAAPGVFEMTFAPDGRATFSFGEPVKEGEPHVIWRRVGTHDVLRQP